MDKKLIFLLSCALILALTISSDAQVNPGTDNLKHRWTFDDGTAADVIGGAHGTVVGDAVIAEGSFTTWELGQYMTLPAVDIALFVYDEITLSAWFSTQDDANNVPTNNWTMLAYFGGISTENAGYGADYYFMTVNRGGVATNHGDSCRAGITVGSYTYPWEDEDGVSYPEFNDGLVHHIGSTLNGGEITLYIDGQFIGAASLTDDNHIEGISPDSAYLAKGGYGVDPTWLGSIHEFSIYDRVLTAEEFLWLFQNDPWTDVDEDEFTPLPTEYSLSQNYPNPFNPTTTIDYILTKMQNVRLTVFDLLGKEVATLVNTPQCTGKYSVTFNGEDLESGIYVYQLKTDNQTISKKMLLTK